MTIATVQEQLSTPEGFAKAVDAKSTALSGFWVFLVLGLLAVGINLMQLGMASDWDWYMMGRFFMDPEAIEFTGRRAGREEMFRYFAVYAPLACFPLSIFFLVRHFVTRRKVGANRFESFQQRGYVARQRFTGLRVKNGNATTDVVLLSHPSVPDETFETSVQQYAGELAALDKKGTKAAVASATKAGVLAGVSAPRLSPTLPAALTFAPAAGKGEFVVVIPPAPGAKTTKTEVLPLKR